MGAVTEYKFVDSDKRFLVTLTCGCRIRLRNNPHRKGGKFSCPSGQGHGYSLTWTSWTDTVTGMEGTRT